MAQKWERSLLNKVAKEMNTVMQLDPAIDHAMMDEETLLTTIQHNAIGGGVEKDAIRKGDDFSAEAWAFFVKIGVWDDASRVVIMPKQVVETEEIAAPVTAEAVEKAVAEHKAVKKKPAAKKPAAKKPAAPAKKAEVKAKEGSVKKMATAAPSKKTQVAKKRATKKVGAKKDAPSKKAATSVKKAVANRDQFGFREGSDTSKAVALLASGKHTMADVKKKFGSTFYSALGKLKKEGFKVGEGASKGTFNIAKEK